MPRVNIKIETPDSHSIRARQVSSMFDAPVQDKCSLEWNVDVPIDADDWQIGMITGPSGSGKTTVMRHLFGEPKKLKWGAASVVDDFEKSHSVEEIAAVCQAVGFNSIPAWLRQYAVLSNGEKFRVELARRLLTEASPVVFDEFTSMVDRQVAKIGAHAVQKYIRRGTKKFVAVSCHSDFADWLQPDWVLDMATCQFQRRLLQRRPAIDIVIGRLPYAAWKMFAPFHYLTGELHVGARCFGLWADGRLAAFSGNIPVPVSSGDRKGESIWRVSRLVTLPDWQGLGLAMVLVDVLGAEYKAAGKRLRTYPAHPALVRSFDKSPRWTMIKAPGGFSTMNTGVGNFGGRPCAVFEYQGEAAKQAVLL